MRNAQTKTKFDNAVPLDQFVMLCVLEGFDTSAVEHPLPAFAVRTRGDDEPCVGRVGGLGQSKDPRQQPRDGVETMLDAKVAMRARH